VAPVHFIPLRLIAAVIFCLPSASPGVAGIDNSEQIPRRRELPSLPQFPEPRFHRTDSVANVALIAGVVFVTATLFGRRRDYENPEVEERGRGPIGIEAIDRARLLRNSTYPAGAVVMDEPRVPVDEPVALRWEPGTYETFRGYGDGMWLLFRQDAELCYSNTSRIGDSTTEYCGPRPQTPTIAVPIRVGQIVRVVDSHRLDDGLDHTPTIRADGALVHVSALNAATPVQHVPGPDQIRKLFHRSADDVAFWKAMIAAPEDDLPRLIYADYLDERGDPAGEIIRGSAPFILQYWVLVDQQWEERNQRRASWRNAAQEFFALARHGAFEFGPGYGRLSMRTDLNQTRHLPAWSVGEWRCLILSGSSGQPLPQFVNYLLRQLALRMLVQSGGIIPEGLIGDQLGPGPQPTVGQDSAA
jgi:uncharacterized protein (TIGR02996 family)